jgi:hypothetical protein
MSGGSMDYVCYRVEDAARVTHDPEFAELLRDAAKVLHDEEWWMSGDTSEEAYYNALIAFKAKWFHGDRNERLKGYIDKNIKELRGELYALIGAKVVSE